MTLDGAITQLQVHALACEDVKAAPTNPPDNLGVYTYALAYVESGAIMGESANTIRSIISIIVEFHVNRTILPEAVKKAKAYIEEFGGKLVGDPTLNGTVQTIIMDENQHILFEFGKLEWATTKTIGVRFHVPIKIRGAI